MLFKAAETESQLKVGPALKNKTRPHQLHNSFFGFYWSSQLDDDDKSLATSVVELDPDFPRILLSLDKTSLILDIKPFRREGSDGEGGLDAVDTNKLVVWVFTELSFHGALLAWNGMVNRKEDTSKNYFKNIGHQFIILQEAWAKKRELIAYIDAVHRIKGDTLYSLADICKCKEKLEKVEYSLNTNKNEFDYFAMRTLLEEAGELSTESLQMAKASLLDELSHELTYEEIKLRGALYKIRKLVDLVAASSQFNYSCVYLPLMNSFLRARLKSILDGNVKLYSSEVLRERNLVNSEPPSIEIAEGSEEEEEEEDDDDDDNEEEELLLWQKEFWK